MQVSAAAGEAERVVNSCDLLDLTGKILFKSKRENTMYPLFFIHRVVLGLEVVCYLSNNH